MSTKFYPVASGSDGNCVYIGTENTHILIDAGVSGKKIEQRISVAGVSGSNIDAIFITHEHTDHIQGAGVLSRRFNIPIFATDKTWRYIDKCDSLGNIHEGNKNIVYKGENVIINDLIVKPFEIPHDGADPVAYTVIANGCKFAIATDIGHTTDSLIENLTGTNVLLLESNHDIEILKHGKYPDSLKNRILGKQGHLSNVSAGQLLTQIMSESLKYVFLGHLSRENNDPFMALNTVTNILESNGIKIGRNHLDLRVACRESISEVLIL